MHALLPALPPVDEQTDPALYYAQRAVAIDPWSLQFREHMIRLLRKRKRTVEAESAVRQGISQDPSWAEGHRLLAMLLKKKHNYTEALQSARQAFALAPTQMRNRNTLVRLLLRNHRIIEAIKIACSHPTKPINALCFILCNGNENIIKKVKNFRKS